jgi:hypothetical protein
LFLIFLATVGPILDILDKVSSGVDLSIVRLTIPES